MRDNEEYAITVIFRHDLAPMNKVTGKPGMVLVSQGPGTNVVYRPGTKDREHIGEEPTVENAKKAAALFYQSSKVDFQMARLPVRSKQHEAAFCAIPYIKRG